MFDLETALRDWRAHMERGTAMSPREVDELEDHLRALIDLELELDGALTPPRAFSLARNDICEPTTLSREFAKAARPRWRRLLLAGCGMFAASWFMPALSDATGRLWGWQAFLAAFEWGNPVETLSALTNILLVLTMYRIGRVRPSKTRWLTWSVTGAAALNLLYWIRVDDLAVGFWAWAGSFVCAAAALWMRDREWASAEVRQAPFTGGGGRRQRIRDERGGSGTLILLAAALVASPASAQSWGWYAGPTLGWRNVFEDPRVGLNGGMSLQEFDGHPTSASTCASSRGAAITVASPYPCRCRCSTPPISAKPDTYSWVLQPDTPITTSTSWI